jgi:streptogramin lyase
MTTPARSDYSRHATSQHFGQKYLSEMAMNHKNNNTAYGFSRIATFALLSSLAALGLVGCSNGMGTSASTSTSPILQGSGAIKGNVHGGQQPVIGAKIQLYYVGSSGLGSAAMALIPTADQVVYNSSAPAGTTGALTDNNGDFLITGDYTCPTTSQQVYLVASGGTSQGVGGAVNSAISLMAPLGDCATLVSHASTTFVQVNEITSIGAIFALAPYMTSYTNVGAATVNNTGLINAVGNFNNLVNLASGAPGGANLPAGATVPTTEINTLANIMASCINTTSSTSGACSTLTTATGATDTIDMMLYFAKNPGSSALTALYGQGSSTAPFVPGYTSQPNDWTIAIKYTAGGTLSSPYGIAIDAAGDAYVTNSGGTTVSKLSPAGVVGTALTGLVGPKAVAIDRTGNVWVANTTASSVVKYNSSGVLQGTYTVGGLNGPVAIAMDSASNAWIANLNGSSVTELSSAGAALQTSLNPGSTISLPTGIALDSTGNVYVANNGGGNVVKLTNAGAVASGSPFTDYALQGTAAVALDSSNNVYAVGSVNGTVSQLAVSQFTSAGVAASYSPVTGPTATATPIYPGIIVTGTNNIIMTSSGTAKPLQAVTLGASPVGNTYGSLNAAIGIAADPSGDVWTANSGDNTVSEFIGLVTPVTTPLAANVGP